MRPSLSVRVTRLSLPAPRSRPATSSRGPAWAAIAALSLSAVSGCALLRPKRVATGAPVTRQAVANANAQTRAQAAREAERRAREAAEASLPSLLEGFTLATEREADVDVQGAFREHTVLRGRIAARRCHQLVVRLSDHAYSGTVVRVMYRFGRVSSSTSFRRLDREGTVLVLREPLCSARAGQVEVQLSPWGSEGWFRGHVHAQLLSAGSNRGPLVDVAREVLGESERGVCAQCRDRRRVCRLRGRTDCAVEYRECLVDAAVSAARCGG